MNLVLPLLFTFLTSYLCIQFAKPIAIKLGLVDLPSVRKQHIGAVPLVGGIAIFIAVLIASMLFFPHSKILNLYLISAALIVFIGALDDFHDLPVKPRLIAQMLVASILVFGAGIYIDNLGNLFGFGNVYLGLFGTLLTVVAVIAAINAFNMMDGIDGLVGIQAIVCFASLAFLFSQSGNQWALLPTLFVAALVAYLRFNLSRSTLNNRKIFMGDAGSMLIGLTVIWLLVIGTQSEQPAFDAVTALWLIAIPLIDMAAIMLRRYRKGESPFKPDRDHLHHIFMRAGFSPLQTLLFITLMSVLCSLVGIGGQYLNVPEWIMLLLFLVMLAVYNYLIQHIWKVLIIYRKLFK